MCTRRGWHAEHLLPLSGKRALRCYKHSTTIDNYNNDNNIYNPYYYYYYHKHKRRLESLNNNQVQIDLNSTQCANENESQQQQQHQAKFSRRKSTTSIKTTKTTNFSESLRFNNLRFARALLIAATIFCVAQLLAVSAINATNESHNHQHHHQQQHQQQLIEQINSNNNKPFLNKQQPHSQRRSTSQQQTLRNQNVNINAYSTNVDVEETARLTAYKSVLVSSICEWKSSLFVPKANEVFFAFNSHAQLLDELSAASSSQTLQLSERELSYATHSALVAALPIKLALSRSFAGFEPACAVRFVVPRDMRILARLTSRKLSFSTQIVSDETTTMIATMTATTTRRANQQLPQLWLNVSETDRRSEVSDELLFESPGNVFAMRLLLSRAAFKTEPLIRLHVVLTAFKSLGDVDSFSGIQPPIRQQGASFVEYQQQAIVDKSFICDNQRLISQKLACDGYKNCVDGYDEHPNVCNNNNNNNQLTSFDKKLVNTGDGKSVVANSNQSSLLSNRTRVLLVALVVILAAVVVGAVCCLAFVAFGGIQSRRHRRRRRQTRAELQATDSTASTSPSSTLKTRQSTTTTTSDEDEARSEQDTSLQQALRALKSRARQAVSALHLKATQLVNNRQPRGSSVNASAASTSRQLQQQQQQQQYQQPHYQHQLRPPLAKLEEAQNWVNENRARMTQPPATIVSILKRPTSANPSLRAESPRGALATQLDARRHAQPKVPTPRARASRPQLATTSSATNSRRNVDLPTVNVRPPGNASRTERVTSYTYESSSTFMSEEYVRRLVERQYSSSSGNNNNSNSNNNAGSGGANDAPSGGSESHQLI